MRPNFAPGSARQPEPILSMHRFSTLVLLVGISQASLAADSVFLEFPIDVSPSVVVVSDAKPGYHPPGNQVADRALFLAGSGTGGSASRGDDSGGGMHGNLIGTLVGAMSGAVKGAVKAVSGGKKQPDGQFDSTDGLDLVATLTATLDGAAHDLGFPAFSHAESDPELLLEPAVLIQAGRQNARGALEVTIRASVHADGKVLWTGIVSGRADGQRPLRGNDGWLASQDAFEAAVTQSARRAAAGIVALMLHELPVPSEMSPCLAMRVAPGRPESTPLALCRVSRNELVVLSTDDESSYLDEYLLGSH